MPGPLQVLSTKVGQIGLKSDGVGIGEIVRVNSLSPHQLLGTTRHNKHDPIHNALLVRVI